MPAMPDTYLARLQADAFAADKAEGEVRKEYIARLTSLERERVFANRRLHMMQALSAAIEGADDEAKALAASDAVLTEEFGLSGGNDGHKVVIERFRTVSDAIDAVLNCEGEPDHAAVLTALAEFEGWYLDRTGKPFMALYDVYVQQTPVVDF